MLAHARTPELRAEALTLETIEAAQRGERFAQSQVVRLHARSVFGLIARVLGQRGRPWVEDTAQEAFVRVLRALPRYQPEDARALSKLILTIAARTAIDALRTHRPTDALVDDAAPAHQRPDRLSERRALGRAIEEAVETLSPEIRAAFVLRAFHDLEYAEIADELGIDVGTVKSRLWRARARLKRLLLEVAP